MPKLLKYVALFLALPLVLAGCKINSINYFPPKPAQIRIVNVLGTTTPINVTANGVPTWSGVNFEGMTAYQDIVNSTTEIAVSLAGSSSVLVSQTYNPAGEQSYTIIVYGTLTSPQLGILADVTQPPQSGKIQLNVFDAAPVGNGVVLGSTSLDVYLVTPGTVIDAQSPIFTFVPYGVGNIFGQFTAGQYELILTVAGTKSIIYDSGALTFPEMTATDLVIYSKGSATLANVLLDDSDGAGQQRVANSKLARIKAVNGAFQSGAVNMLLDGNAVTSNVAYATATVYNTIEAGQGTVSFEASATPGASIGSVSSPLPSATDQSVFVAGFAGATTAVTPADNNLPPLSGNVNVRFVNASPNSPPLDVLSGNVTKVSALGTYAASPYVQLSSGTTTYTFVDSTTGATVLTLPDITLNAQQTTTVYVVGAAGALSGFISPDTP